jgi:hypothetical protein
MCNKMEFRKCEPCLLCKKLEPGITIHCEIVGVYTLVCLATGEKLEITSCIKNPDREF